MEGRARKGNQLHEAQFREDLAALRTQWEGKEWREREEGEEDERNVKTWVEEGFLIFYQSDEYSLTFIYYLPEFES